MKGVSTAPGDYVYFKSQVPLHKIPIGTKQWRYYDFGPKIVTPLVCIPGTAGTADVYYKQIMALSMKGYRVISIDVPRVWNHHEWIQAFEKFLDAIDVHHIHIYGTSLGGFLAQVFAQHRPRRVRSLVLSNAYLDTQIFSAAMPWAIVVGWTPSFLLKRYVLSGIRDGPHEPFIADSVDFVVSQVESLSREDLASRLTLTVDSASVGPLLLSDAFITLMDTNDYCAIPQQLKDEVGERYPGARRAYLKSGGDFPFLSRPDEVNLHLQLHLRRVGLEPRPDLVPGALQNCISENPTREDEREVSYYTPRDEEGSSLAPSRSDAKEDLDDPSKDKDEEEEEEEETPDDPLENDERKDPDYPPKDDGDDADDEGSPSGPSESKERGDADSPRNDGGGSYEGHPNNNRPENLEDFSKDDGGSTGDHSKELSNVDFAKYKQQSTERHPESIDSWGLEQESCKTVNKTSHDIRLALLVSYHYFLPMHLGTLCFSSLINSCIGS